MIDGSRAVSCRSPAKALEEIKERSWGCSNYRDDSRHTEETITASCRLRFKRLHTEQRVLLLTPVNQLKAGRSQCSSWFCFLQTSQQLFSTCSCCDKLFYYFSIFCVIDIIETCYFLCCGFNILVILICSPCCVCIFPLVSRLRVCQPRPHVLHPCPVTSTLPEGFVLPGCA